MEKLTGLFIVIPFLLALNFAQSLQSEAMNGKEYINTNPEQCRTLRFLCAPGKEPFFDEYGCGCVNERSAKKDIICTEEFDPVCGLKQIQCITTPCEPVWQTYPNRCYAKRDGATNIKPGECP